MNTIEGKKRIWYWDNLKFFLILTVVVGHIIEQMETLGSVKIYGVFLFIYSFHMPLFLFVSGLFYKNTKPLQKIIFYLAAGYLLKLLTYLRMLFQGGTPVFKPFTESGAPWFMFALAWYTAVMWLVRKVDRRIVLAVAVVVPLITGNFEGINDFLCASRSIVFFPFFVLGTMFKPFKLAKKVCHYQKKLFIPALCVLVVWFVVCYTQTDTIKILHRFFTGRWPFSQEVQPIGFLYRLLTDLLAVIFGAAVMLLIPHGERKPFSQMGGNTLNVYFWHYFFIYIILYPLGLSKLYHTGVMSAVFLLLGFVLTVILSAPVFNFPLKHLQTLIINPKKIFDKIKRT